MNNLTNINSPENSSALSVILSQQKFADMILNFLGKKEKLTYQVDEKSFFIRLNDLEQFYYLLEAKISKEKEVYLDHFLVTISYNDGTKREITGIESLNNFNETRDVMPIDVTITWNIVIKYPKAETIENQQVEITFIKDGDNQDNSKIILIIHHTNQAWGIEVLNLLKDKIGELTIQQSKKYKNSKRIKSLFSSISSVLSPALIFLIVISSLSYGKNMDSEHYYKIIPYYNDNLRFIEKDISLYSIEHLNSDYLRRTANDIIKSSELRSILLNIADSKDSQKWYLFKKILLDIFSLLFPVLILYFYFEKACAFYFMPSFILISRRSESQYEHYKNSKNNVEFYSITLIAFTITIGVIVNYIYQLISSF